MKEIVEKESIYLEDYDVHIKPYLSYGEIQNILNGIKASQSWGERQQNMDMMVMYYVTDISAEELEKIGHEKLLRSGLIESVMKNVKNLYQIQEGILHTESIARALNQIALNFPEIFSGVLTKNVENHK